MVISREQTVILKKKIITGTEMKSWHVFVCNGAEHTEDKVHNIEPRTVGQKVAISRFYISVQ